MVARDLDVDYRAGGDSSGEEDGGEFDLSSGQWLVCALKTFGRGRTMRFSSVRRIARPASTFPTVRDISIVGGRGLDTRGWIDWSCGGEL